MGIREADGLGLEEQEGLLEMRDRRLHVRSSRQQNTSTFWSLWHRCRFLLLGRLTTLQCRLLIISALVMLSLVPLLLLPTASITTFKTWMATHNPSHGLDMFKAEVTAHRQALARLEALQKNLTRQHLEEDVVIKGLGEPYDLLAYRHRLHLAYQRYFAPLTSSGEEGPFGEMWNRVEEHLLPAQQPISALSHGIPHLVTSSARNSSDLPNAFERWQKHHPDWKVEVYDDDHIDAYFRHSFTAMGRNHTSSTRRGEADDFYTQWLRMPYPILRIDTFRYLKVFLDGGVYCDSDTGSLYSVPDWPGMSAPHAKVLEKGDGVLKALEDKLDSSTQGKSTANFQPAGLVLAIEYDAPGKHKQWKELKLARPLQITQFAFLAQPFHPVLLDCLGTIMDYANAYNASPVATEGVEFMNLILDWTGPGLFTDAVNRYLVARYGVDPFVLAGLDDRAGRIGDVLVYPEFAFGIDDTHHLSKDFELVHHGFLHRWIDHFYDG